MKNSKCVACGKCLVKVDNSKWYHMIPTGDGDYMLEEPCNDGLNNAIPFKEATA
jgi:hypothetical protein